MSRLALKRSPVVRPRSRAERRPAIVNPSPARTIVPPPDDASEASLLAFDSDADLESLVPMPPSIPLAVRQALAAEFARRFEHHEELDAWIHCPHPALAGCSPFERIVAGDGETVLAALLEGGRVAGPEAGADPRRGALRGAL